MDILYGTKINQLLANTAPTGLLFADWLKKKDYSVQLQKKYRNSDMRQLPSTVLMIFSEQKPQSAQKIPICASRMNEAT